MIFFYYLINFILLSGLGFLYWRQQRQEPAAGKKAFYPALILKLLCGVLLGLFYRHFYGYGDTFQYQTQSMFLYDYFLDNPGAYLRLWLTNRFESETIRTSMVYPGYSNSYFMVITLSLLNIVTGGHYFLNSLYFSFFSFFGAWQLVRAMAAVYPQWRWAAIGAFLFFPSAVFWSSGVSKEAIYMGALYWLLAGILTLFSGRGFSWAWKTACLLVAAWLLWKIKYYFAAVIFPLAGSYVFIRWAASRFPVLGSFKKQLLCFAAFLLVSALVVSQMHEVFRVDFFLAQLFKSYELILAASPGKPTLLFPGMEPNLGSVLAHFPLAAVHAVFRPFIWEGGTLPYLLAGLENGLVGLLFLSALVNLVINGRGRMDWFVLILLIYCGVIAALIGLSTPNVGSLSRYKTAFQPFLVFLLLTTWRWRRSQGKEKETALTD